MGRTEDALYAYWAALKEKLARDRLGPAAFGKATNIMPPEGPPSPAPDTLARYNIGNAPSLNLEPEGWPVGLDNARVMPELQRNSAFNRPNAPDTGGPEDMVRAAIMRELRYLLAPDVSAAPLAPDELKAMGAGAEYQNLDYDTPLSNPRVAEAIGPLMEMYAGVGRARQQERMGEQELSGARAREDLTRAQAENYRKYGGTKNPYKPGEAKAVLDTLGKTYRQAMAMIARIDKETVGGLVDLGNGPEQSAEVRARLQQQIDAMKRAAQLGDAANTAEQSGDYQAAMDYANQARMLMLQYGIEDTDVATGTPAPGGSPSTTGAGFVAAARARQGR